MQHSGEVIADLRCKLAERDALIDLMRGQMAAQGIDSVPVPSPVLSALTVQERSFVGALYQAYPRSVGVLPLLEVLPALDRALDRNDALVSVLACRVRKKLGAEAVETVRSQGYRLGSNLRAQLQG